ncbi:outer membrane protein transport protein [Novosphingobium sp. ZN18A2]|uniref:OmpP1/FadL family transporter n=1 Tax=Novosphingobium sp. ZN18A2 TaxID=3079861 RepID=UPI0030CD1933
MVRFKKGAWLFATAAATVLAPAAAHATDGYFLNGISITDKGQAGAGVANPETPLTLGVNPAGIAEIDSQVEIGASLFMPRRQFTGSGDPGFTPSGTVKSGSKYFILPSAAASWKLDDNSAIGVAVFGNGGLNTNYGETPNPACVSPPLPASTGVFCGGGTGVNLIQAFVSVGYARKFGDHLTVGVAPVFGMQIFHAAGLAAFSYDMSGNPLTVDPTKLTNNGNSTSSGFGVRVGALVKITPAIKLGASYQTKMNMSRFKKYAGLFENGGDFDIPSNYTVGLSISPTPMVTFMADYRRINYSDVPAVSNSSLTPAQFGSVGGPGFGWKDTNEYKFGLVVRPSQRLTLRAGMAFNDNPVPSSDATINILAPGVSDQHYTAGLGFATGERSAINLAFVFSPDSTTNGFEVTPAGPNPGHLIQLKMHQYELGIGWSHKF